jgi:carbamate kinase
MLGHHQLLQFVEDSGRGYRRVVPSPMPINIVELDSIETLIKHGTSFIVTFFFDNWDTATTSCNN